MTIEQLYSVFKQYPSIQTDTRKLKKGDIFFALKGDHFDGNQFAEKALEAGAYRAVIDNPDYQVPGKTILVEDSLLTLQQLAQYHREQFSNLSRPAPIPFIAVTGSNGKTTTKELIHAVLSTTYKTYTTEGNLNNHIGIPLTLLRIKDDAEMVVIEMGANHLHEIEGYCKYAQPTHGLITNCGKAHLEGFGSIEGVKKGKGELFDYLRTLNDGVAFVMWDYEYLREMSKGISGIIKYGTNDAHVMGRILTSEPFLEIMVTQGMEAGNIKTQLVGDYNFPNVLAAITVGKYFKVTDQRIKSAIQNYLPSNSRSQLIEKGTNKIILDAYNANPSSMRLAIENFAKMNAEKKVLLLGAMAELGTQSLPEHENLVELIRQYDWDAVALVGGDFLKITHPFHSFENADEAGQWLAKQSFQHTYLLVKGSRSMQMEKVVAA